MSVHSARVVTSTCMLSGSSSHMYKYMLSSLYRHINWTKNENRFLMAMSIFFAYFCIINTSSSKWCHTQMTIWTNIMEWHGMGWHCIESIERERADLLKYRYRTDAIILLLLYQIERILILNWANPIHNNYQRQFVRCVSNHQRTNDERSVKYTIKYIKSHI